MAGSLLTLVFTVSSNAARVVPWVTNDVSWQYYYNPDVTVNTNYYDKLPNDATNTWPAWNVVASAGSNTSVSITDNYLTISTPDSNGAMSYRQSTGYGLGDGLITEFTLETLLRVTSINEGATYAGSFLFGTGATGKYNEILYSPTGIGRSGNIISVDLTEWTLVRFTFTDTVNGSMYINNDPTPVATFALTNNGTFGYFQFGDGSVSAGRGGTVEVDFIRWTDLGAYAPIPEPTALALTLALAIFGFAAMILGPRRKKKTTLH